MTQLLNDVTDQNIQFVTARVEGSPLPSADRRVIVTGPPQAVEVASTGDVNLLDELVGMLLDHNRAWAAEVMLACLTHHEENLVNAFAAHPEQWRDSLGKNAHQRWSEWLKPRRARLRWDAQERAFVEGKEQ
jgi:hypothetical protein